MFSNKLNPFILLGKIPLIKKKFEDKGTTHLDVVNKVWTDKRFGFGIVISGGGLAITYFLFLLAVYDIANGLLDHPIKSSWLPILLCMGIAYITCHFAVFKEDKYLRYFKRFERWSNLEKWKYGLLSAVFVFGSVVLWIYSFKFIFVP
jgi:hypothetical protein